MCSFLFCLKESVERITLLNLQFCWLYWFKSENTHYQKLWTSLEKREKQALRSTNDFYLFQTKLETVPKATRADLSKTRFDFLQPRTWPGLRSISKTKLTTLSTPLCQGNINQVEVICVANSKTKLTTLSTPLCQGNINQVEV